MLRTSLSVTTILLAVPVSADEPRQGHVEVNGMQMYYEVSGAGEPLVVLHGSQMSIPSMGEIIALLAESHKVYAIELQGHGRTTDIDRPITYPNLAADVSTFMDAVGIEKADVFGFSMGAITGLKLAIDYPEKVDQLVFASGVFDSQGWQSTYRDAIPHLTVDMFTSSFLAEEHRKLSSNPDGFPVLMEKLIDLQKDPMDWREDVSALKTPVLIIVGDSDGLTVEHGVDLYRLLGGGAMTDGAVEFPAVRLAVLPATSHTALIGQADLMMEFIGPFLRDERPKGWFD
jgi:pimeloyl-ACP methyl ester carboxylesterase